MARAGGAVGMSVVPRRGEKTVFRVAVDPRAAKQEAHDYKGFYKGACAHGSVGPRGARRWVVVKGAEERERGRVTGSVVEEEDEVDRKSAGGDSVL